MPSTIRPRSLLTPSLFLLQIGLAGAAPADELFLPVEQPGQALGVARSSSESRQSGELGATLRSRLARLNVPLLEAARSAARGEVGADDLIDLNLFQDSSFQVVGLRTAPTSQGYSLSGGIEGMPHGMVTLVVNGDVVAGVVRMHGAVYTIRSAGDGVLEIRQADSGTLPGCGGDLTVPAETVPGPTTVAEPALGVGAPQRITPVEIDVLVVYTEAAKRSAGGEAPLLATIDLWTTETNNFYSVSGVNQRIRLAHVEELDYVETKDSWDLGKLVLPKDGVMDEVHSLRDAVGADMVHLVEAWGTLGRSSYCGIAYGMRNVSSAFAAEAFGATVLECGSTTFAHELGHGMGLRHDRYTVHLNHPDGITNEVYTYSYGYVNQAAFTRTATAAERFRTIMAYQTQCEQWELPGCAETPRFSNPTQSLTNHPLGVPSTADSSLVTGPADAVSTLNKTAATVAAFRSPPSDPVIVSLKRRAPTQERTNQTTLVWRLAFSEDMSNVTDNDFVVSGEGIGTPQLGVASVSARVYDITARLSISGATVVGELGFATTHDIAGKDGGTLSTAWPAAAERGYTVDREGPSVTISPSKANSSPFIATIRFNEDVSGLRSSRFVSAVSATKATVGTPVRSDARTYTVEVTPDAPAAKATIRLDVRLATDVVGNYSTPGSRRIKYNPSTKGSFSVGGLSDVSVAENGTWNSATPTVTGKPVKTLTWTKEGADANHFTIDSATGVLGLSGLDFEQPADADNDSEYHVTAKATDEQGNSSSAGITVTVTDAVEARTLAIVGASSKKVPERLVWRRPLSLVGDKVCKSNVCRVDDGPVGAVSWSVKGDDAAFFEHFPSSGNLYFRAKDFEQPADADADNDYEVTLEATDADGNSASLNLTMRVINGHPRWLTIRDLASTTVPENTTWTSRTPREASGRAHGSLIWTKEGVDEAQFSVDPATGVLSMAAQDYENPADADGNNSYEVSVRVTDVESNSVALPLTVTVTGVNEAPAAVGKLAPLTTLRVEDSAQDVDVSGAFSDSEGDALTYAAKSADTSVATVTVSGSTVTVTAKGTGAAMVTVTATDVGGSNMSATQEFMATVLPARGVTIVPTRLAITEGSKATYTVVLASQPSGPVSVTPSAPANTDVSVAPSELRFTLGNWNAPQTVTVTVAKDADAVADSDVMVQHAVVGGGYRSVTAAAVGVSILETDKTTVSVTDARTVENAGTLVFSVSLSVASSSAVTVDYATSNGNGASGAVAGSDYNATQGTLSFAPRTTVRTVAVTVHDDDDDEAEEETFRFTLSNVANALLAGGGKTLQVTGTIEDDDDPRVEVSFGAPNYEAKEGESVAVTLRLSAPPERSVTVPLLATHHGGATPSDYRVPGSVTFSSRQTERTFTFTATDDSADDDGEAVVLSFGSLPSRVSGDDETMIAIQDNDASGGGGPPPAQDPEPPPTPSASLLTVSASAAGANERAGAVVFNVRLSRASSSVVTVDYATADGAGAGAAKAGSDYTATAGTLTFATGSRAEQIRVPVTDDGLYEAAETFTLTLRRPVNATLAGGGSALRVLGTIHDDDDGPPMAAFEFIGATCDEELCRARTGAPVEFIDTSTGKVLSRHWDFGDGRTSRSRRVAQTWSSPGFYEVTLVVSDGAEASTASREFLVEAAERQGMCIADAETLCLRDSRYAVTVEWWTADGEGGAGRVVHRGTNDSGLFTFFGGENWEVLMKVLDGCALNGHTWVYTASTTDLGYVTRVTDTLTSVVKEYRSEPGLPAPAITDTTAFPGSCDE